MAFDIVLLKRVDVRKDTGTQTVIPTTTATKRDRQILLVIINQPTAQPSVFHGTKFGVIFTLYSVLANTLQQQVWTWVHCAEEEIKYEMPVM